MKFNQLDNTELPSISGFMSQHMDWIGLKEGGRKAIIVSSSLERKKTLCHEYGVCYSPEKVFQIFLESYTVKIPLGRAFGMGRNLLHRFGSYRPAGERTTHLYGLGSQAGKLHYVVVAPRKRIPSYMKLSQLWLYIF
jgi:hypothetical protein